MRCRLFARSPSCRRARETKQSEKSPCSDFRTCRGHNSGRAQGLPRQPHKAIGLHYKPDSKSLNPMQIRALLYMGTIGNALMQAMGAFEVSLRAALHTEDIGDSSQVARPVLDAIQILREAVLSESSCVPLALSTPYGGSGETVPVHRGSRCSIRSHKIHIHKKQYRDCTSAQRVLVITNAILGHFCGGKMMTKPAVYHTKSNRYCWSWQARSWSM